MNTWVENEFQSVDFGDVRLNTRLNILADALAASPNRSIPQACGSRYAAKATYRFFDNKAVNAEEILYSHYMMTSERCEEHETILAVQDTTDMDFTGHSALQGVGYLEASYLQGIKIHSTLAVSAEGVPLGLIDQYTWVRNNEEIGKKNKRRSKNTSEKESQRWLDAEDATEKVLEGIPCVVTVCDREADIFDLFAKPRGAGRELLIRNTQNRCLDNSSRKLHEEIEAQPVAAKIRLELQRRDGNPKRTAELSLRYHSVKLSPPTNRRARNKIKPVDITLILAWEENPPPNTKAVRWLLMTTLQVLSIENALQCLKWYSYRWLVERYHYVLKSGCGLEKLQLGTAERLKRAFAVYCVVAWRLLWLTYEARVHPNISCEPALQVDEWQALSCIHFHTAIPLSEPPSLGEAVQWIALLGGFLGRKGDGQPGVKVLWRGWNRLQDFVAARRLFLALP